MQSLEFFAPHMAHGLDERGERNLKYGAISDGASLRYIDKLAIYTGPGYRQVCDMAQSAAVDDLFGGKHQKLKKLWAKCGTKLFHSVDTIAAGYDVNVTALEAAERLFMIEQSNGDVFGFNQLDTPFRVATALLKTAITPASTEIEVGVQYIDKFAASGDVVINGDTIAYGARDTGTGKLTSVTGIASNHAADSLITQYSEPATMVDLAGNAVKGTCAMEMEGSLIVAGILGTEDILRISAPSTLDNPEYYYDFQGNGASFKVMPNPVTAMSKGTDRGYIFGESYFVATTGFDVASGILLTIPMPDGYGAYNPRSVINMGGRTLAFGNKRLYPIDIVASRNPDEPSKSKLDEDFDSEIQPWLQSLDDDQSDSALLQYDTTQKIVTVTGKVDGSLQTRLFDNNDGVKAFIPKETRPMRCHVFFNGKSYFGNSVNSKVYRNHYGRTNAGLAIAHRWKTGLLEDRKGRKELLANFLRFDGYMTKACEFNLKVYNDSSSTPIFDQDYDDSVITSSIGRPLGSRGIGNVTLGGDTSTPTLVYKYEVEVELTGLSAQGFYLEWTITKEGAFFQQNSFLMDCHGVRFTSRDRI